MLRITISRGLFAVTLAVVTLLTAASILYTREKNREQALITSQELMARTAEIVHLKIDGLIQPIDLIVDTAADWPNLELRPTVSGHVTRNVLIALIRDMPHVKQIFMGYENGDFYQIRAAAQTSQAVLDDIGAPDGTVFTEDIILRADRPETLVVRRFFAADGRIISATTEPDSDYDPRTRPWYQNARQSDQPIRTDVYEFFTAKVPGLTVAQRFQNGVIGIDMTLAEINRFLVNTPQAEYGGVAIYHADGRIFARSDANLRNARGTGPIDTLVAEAVKQPESMQHIVQIDGHRWIAHTAPVALGARSTEKLLVAMPIRQIVAPITRTAQQAALFTLVLFLASIPILWLLARRMSKPILRLVETTDQIRNFQLSDGLDHKSVVSEIARLETAMDGMRHNLRSFSVYVPKTLVKKFVERGEEPTIGGERRDVTVLFMDLENFTAMSAAMEPEEVMARMSRYFEIATRILLDHDATIDKFIGDAVMALWNAPIDTPGHVIRACEAALEIQKAAKAETDSWSVPGVPPLRTRIGLATGPAIVGNVGSSDRMNYTALGATVNLAARLESLNRELRTSILVSRDVAIAAAGHFVFEEAGETELKGFPEPVPVYQLLSAVEDKAA